MTEWTNDRHAAARKACEEADAVSGVICMPVPLFAAAIDEIERLTNALAREVQSHGETVDSRDAFEEQIDEIADALGDKTEWSSANDRGANCIELIAAKEEEIEKLQKEIHRLSSVAIMTEHVLLSLDALRVACEPFRCDTFGCETSETEALDKACSEADAHRNSSGLLEASKASRTTAIADAYRRGQESMREAANRYAMDCIGRDECQRAIADAIRSLPLRTEGG